MSSARVSTHPTNLREQAARVREQFQASGTNISEWARERGFSPTLVSEVLTGNRRCIRGKSHKVAVALGLKPSVPAPGIPAPVTRRHPDGPLKLEPAR